MFFIGMAGTLTSMAAVALDSDFKYVGHKTDRGIICWLLRDRSARLRRLNLCLDGLAEKVLGNGNSNGDLWPKIDCLAVGVAGTDFRYSGKSFLEAVSLHYPEKHVVLSSIGEVSYCGAALMRPGVLIRAGTGSTVYGVDGHGNNHTTNAWDPFIGDQGSGLVMTMALLRAAACCEDKRLTSSAAKAVWDAVVGKYGCSSLFELHERLLRKQEVLGTAFNEALVDLGHLVFDLAEIGNEIARDIVSEGASELVRGVKAVVDTLDFSPSEGVPVFLSGNVLCANRCFQEAIGASIARLQSELGIRLDVSSGQYAPSVGAALFACAGGRKLPERFTLDQALSSLPSRDACPELYCHDIAPDVFGVNPE